MNMYDVCHIAYAAVSSNICHSTDFCSCVLDRICTRFGIGDECEIDRPTELDICVALKHTLLWCADLTEPFDGKSHPSPHYSQACTNYGCSFVKFTHGAWDGTIRNYTFDAAFLVQPSSSATLITDYMEKSILSQESNFCVLPGIVLLYSTELNNSKKQGQTSVDSRRYNMKRLS